ncbi:MAG TPA: MotA/TolQ/ExbB proton channel family protein [Lacunisphaera sp.]|jgi:biopolymer transport protein ExbB
MSLRRFTFLASFAFLTTVVIGAETFDQAIKRATVDYTERLRQAAEELNRARTQVADQKAPLLTKMRGVEDRIITFESQIQRFEAGQEEAGGKRRKLIKNVEAARKTGAYFNTLVRDGTKTFTDGLAPGEEQLLNERLQSLQQKIDEQAGASVPDVQPAVDLAEFLLAQTEQSVGGRTAAGNAIMGEGNQVIKGTFAFVGPSTYFLPAQGGPAGAVWSGPSSTYSVMHPLPGWNVADSAAFFAGQTASVLADISGGKALRLKETQGTLRSHIDAGGLVAYVIIAVGLLALLLVLQKTRDLAHMKLDSPKTVQAFLVVVARGVPDEIARSLKTLKGTTRELFTVGVEGIDRPKTVLEERLQSVLLRQQQYYERRLPLLAVIATAAPLMGLLGTVVGMVKTFALITVFGTGNAGKLASGISQVLVATELGLIVAIPTLIAHGFLAQRIHRNLSLLERYALEFVTTVEDSRDRLAVDEGTNSVIA